MQTPRPFLSARNVGTVLTAVTGILLSVAISAVLRIDTVAIRVLDQMEMTAVFGDANCTACIGKGVACLQPFKNGNGKCGKCNADNTTYNVCCSVADHMAVDTACNFTMTPGCGLEVQYLEGTLIGEGSCHQCTGNNFAANGDCDTIYTADPNTSQICNLCPS